ncbi:hypothetical protein H6P81_012547 [Aristolochia fimbriata]|uniref:Uncharacterized protein n=1 Tax=Aristolochia fimbriata TaxID=158543 RepID=A0AAV7ECG8_ARIFI|nr:hypothetical protein H6P81_012547 [Aristolochia fimbriata]
MERVRGAELLWKPGRLSKAYKASPRHREWTDRIFSTVESAGPRLREEANGTSRYQRRRPRDYLLITGTGNESFSVSNPHRAYPFPQ